MGTLIYGLALLDVKPGFNVLSLPKVKTAKRASSEIDSSSKPSAIPSAIGQKIWPNTLIYNILGHF